MNLYECDYIILEEIKTGESVCMDDFPEFKRKRASFLEQKGLVTIQSKFNPKYITVQSRYVSITPAGMDALSSDQKKREQEADNDRKFIADSAQQKANNRNAFCRDLVIAIISGLVVLAVEHCGEIINFFRVSIDSILSLFH